MTIYALRFRDIPGALSFSISTFGGFISSIAYLIQLKTAELGANLFWSNVQYIGFAIMPVAWFLMAVYFSRQDEWLNWERILLLCMIPLATITIAFSNRLSPLIRFDVYVTPLSDSIYILHKTYGPWFWVHSTYSYLLIFASVFVLIKERSRLPAPYRGQVSSLLIGIFLIMLSNWVYIFFRPASWVFDPTPFVFSISGIIMAWGLFRYRLFDIKPIARDQIVETMWDGVIILDSNGRLIDINPAAQKIFTHGDISPKINGPFENELKASPELIELCKSNQNVTEEISITVDCLPLVYAVTLSLLKSERAQFPNKLIMLHDITSQKQIQNELFALSITDSLTGLPNRREFFEKLPLRIAEAKRNQNDLTLVMIDIDNFKQINDTLGHQAGDLAMKLISSAIRQSLRTYDLAARYGGDEFAILLPQTSLTEANSITARLLNAIELAGSEVNMPLTASGGIAELYPLDDPEGTNLIARADEALLRAKSSGKGTFLD